MIDLVTLREVDLLADGRLTGWILGSPFQRAWRLVAGPAEYQDQARQNAETEQTSLIVEIALWPATPNPLPNGGSTMITLTPSPLASFRRAADRSGVLLRVRIYECLPTRWVQLDTPDPTLI